MSSRPVITVAARQTYRLAADGPQVPQASQRTQAPGPQWSAVRSIVVITWCRPNQVRPIFVSSGMVLACYFSHFPRNTILLEMLGIIGRSGEI
jgi:hypothetical protein